MIVDFTIADYRFRAYQVFIDGGPWDFAQFCALAEKRVSSGVFGAMISTIGVEVLKRHVSGVPPGGISRVMNRVFQTPNGPQRLITRHSDVSSPERPLVMAISPEPSVCWLQSSGPFQRTDWAVQLLSLP